MRKNRTNLGLLHHIQIYVYYNLSVFVLFMRRGLSMPENLAEYWAKMIKKAFYTIVKS